MKTTFDLPPDLIRDVKLRAVHECRKLTDMVAEVLNADSVPKRCLRGSRAQTVND
ncbi:MAG: hypothetical protein WCP35_04865 [Verrucomicrobiota bacterium]